MSHQLLVLQLLPVLLACCNLKTMYFLTAVIRQHTATRQEHASNILTAYKTMQQCKRQAIRGAGVPHLNTNAGRRLCCPSGLHGHRCPSERLSVMIRQTVADSPPYYGPGPQVQGVPFNLAIEGMRAPVTKMAAGDKKNQQQWKRLLSRYARIAEAVYM